MLSVTHSESALVWKKTKANILLEMINEVTVNYLDPEEDIQQCYIQCRHTIMLQEKWKKKEYQ